MALCKLASEAARTNRQLGTSPTDGPVLLSRLVSEGQLASVYDLEARRDTAIKEAGIETVSGVAGIRRGKISSSAVDKGPSASLASDRRVYMCSTAWDLAFRCR